MSNQGFKGALAQYWTVEDKPRLTRRNTWFEEHQPSRKSANQFYIGITVVALAIAISVTVFGVML